MFLNVVDGVGRCKDFGLVDVVYTECFEDLDSWMSATGHSPSENRCKAAYLALDEVAYPRLGHDRYRDGFHDLLD